MKDIWVPVSGAIAQQRNVDVIANNVANINTPGFKKDQLVFKEYLTSLEKGTQDTDLPQKEWAPKDFYRSYGAENGYVVVDGSYTIHQQGNLSPTGNTLDFALQGNGMFELLTPNGIRYSRRGTFSVDKEGTLVNDQGFQVLSKMDWTKIQGTEIDGTASTDPANIKIPQPEERVIKIPEGKISANSEGQLFVGENPITELSVVEFNDVVALKKEGSGLYINPGIDNVQKGPIKTSVHQGFIEGSNVNAVSEMSELLKANRQFDSIMRAIKAYDNIAGRGVNEIGKF